MTLRMPSASAIGRLLRGAIGEKRKTPCPSGRSIEGPLLKSQKGD
jgi:hypothetical protein